MELTLFQALRYENTKQYIETHGPFLCQDNEAWLGIGYYFWDGDISHALWWGRTSLNRSYIVCEAQATMDGRCWDLLGNLLHLKELKHICLEMSVKLGKPLNQLSIAAIIMYLRKHKLLEYNAIRALPIPGKIPGDDPATTKFLPKYRVPMNKKTTFELDLNPRVQVCLFEPRALSLQDYRVVWPQHFANPFV